MFRFLLAPILAAAFFNAQADARPVSWSSTESPIRVSGYPVGEVEGDHVLEITCPRWPKVQVGIGAYKDIGKGRSGVFSVTLRSGNRSATVSGKSALSSNSEMTGARELRAQMTLDGSEKLRAVLTNGLPITVSGALNDTWTVRGLASKIWGFGEGCSNN